jgi:hypothetical protein
MAGVHLVPDAAATIERLLLQVADAFTCAGAETALKEPCNASQCRDSSPWLRFNEIEEEEEEARKGSR